MRCIMKNGKKVIAKKAVIHQKQKRPCGAVLLREHHQPTRKTLSRYGHEKQEIKEDRKCYMGAPIEEQTGYNNSRCSPTFTASNESGKKTPSIADNDNSVLTESVGAGVNIASAHQYQIPSSTAPIHHVPTSSICMLREQESRIHLTLPYLESPTKAGEDTSVPTTLKHLKMRPINSLSTPGDSTWLSQFNCFVRSECLEMFVANAEDIMKDRRKPQRINMTQVGIRCRFCAHIEHTKRKKYSATFPSKLNSIYESVAIMANDHFPICTEIPVDINTRLITLKGEEVEEYSQCKYWEESASHLGMKNGPNTGIFMIPTLLPNDEFAAFVLGALIEMSNS